MAAETGCVPRCPLGEPRRIDEIDRGPTHLASMAKAETPTRRLIHTAPAVLRMQMACPCRARMRDELHQMGLSGNPAEMNGRNLKFQSLAPVCPLHFDALERDKVLGASYSPRLSGRVVCCLAQQVHAVLVSEVVEMANAGSSIRNAHLSFGSGKPAAKAERWA